MKVLGKKKGSNTLQKNTPFGSMDVHGFSWNHQCQWRTFIYKIVGVKNNNIFLISNCSTTQKYRKMFPLKEHWSMKMQLLPREDESLNVLH